MGFYQHIKEDDGSISIFYSGDGEGCVAHTTKEKSEEFKKGKLSFEDFDWEDC